MTVRAYVPDTGRTIVLGPEDVVNEILDAAYIWDEENQMYVYDDENGMHEIVVAEEEYGPGWEEPGPQNIGDAGESIGANDSTEERKKQMNTAAQIKKNQMDREQNARIAEGYKNIYNIFADPKVKAKAKAETERMFRNEHYREIEMKKMHDTLDAEFKKLNDTRTRLEKKEKRYDRTIAYHASVTMLSLTAVVACVICLGLKVLGI